MTCVLLSYSRFCITLTFLIVYLQGTELFPTQLRSTGSGFAATVAAAIAIAGPSIVSLVRNPSFYSHFIHHH